ncbi:MAG: thioredoxin [Blastocatellia bacterium]|nr:thioredoxin [Blastocatellia bacterium]
MSTTTETQLIRCGECGATNRVPLERLQEKVQPVCGRCKKPLTVSVHPLIITDANFADEVERFELPVLLDMWAVWCGPCRMIAPVIEELATELAGRVRVGKLNIDENPATPARFGVRSIPTLLILKDGREVDRIIGAVSRQEILRKLQAVM